MYFSNNQVLKLNKCAVSLLMGCSSGFLPYHGNFEPNGTALSYLIAGW